MRTIATLAQGRDNNFNLLRMLAASSVLISHAFPIALGDGAAEPLDHVAPVNLGRIAVALFFSVSGFFIAKSFDRRTSLVAFAVDRVVRIYPALLVVLLLTVLLLGPILGNLPPADYWLARGTWTYLPHNLSLVRMQWSLPGLFTHNPTGAVNGSLWTLGYEVGCYGMVVLVGLAGLLNGRRFILFLAAYAVLYVASPSGGGVVPVVRELTLPFVIGMAFYVHRERIVLHWGILLASLLLVLAARHMPFYREAFAWLLAYGSFYFGALPWPWLKAYNRLGDYSYGMYIYAFPIEQMTVALAPGVQPLAVVAAALPTTLLIAVLSWKLIEEPALARRHAIGRRLTQRPNTLASAA